MRWQRVGASSQLLDPPSGTLSVAHGDEGPSVRPDDHTVGSAPAAVWAPLCPPGTVTVSWTEAAGVLPLLAPGTQVAIVADRPFLRRAVRRRCDRAGVRVERELVALPSGSRPLVLFDDHPQTVSAFWDTVATVPPARGWITALGTLALVLGARAPWRWTGALAPGRVVLGVRR
jgi:hypothetical protein